MYINKYKAWDTNKNIMYSAEELGKDELTINPDGRGFVNVSSISPKLSVYMPHIIPLQFTGQNKEGKEIYESDIGILENYTCVLKFDSLDCAFRWIDMKTNQWITGRPSDAKIIGNIYENPKLMK